MDQHDVTLLAKREASGEGAPGGAGATTEFAAFDSETHREAYARLGWVALTYAGTYAAAFGISWLLESLHSGLRPPMRSIIIAAISMARQLARCQDAVGAWTEQHALNWWRTHVPGLAVRS